MVTVVITATRHTIWQLDRGMETAFDNIYPIAVDEKFGAVMELFVENFTGDLSLIIIE